MNLQAGITANAATPVFPLRPLRFGLSSPLRPQVFLRGLCVVVLVLLVLVSDDPMHRRPDDPILIRLDNGVF